MGQRLSIIVHAFNEDVAAIYYHWSAYTIDALEEAKKIIGDEELLNSASKEEFLYKLIRLIEKNGGSCAEDDLKYVACKYQRDDFNTQMNSTYGMIGISDREFNAMANAGEHQMVIDFDEEEVKHNVINTYDSYDEYSDFLSGCDIPCPGREDIPDIGYDPTDVSFNGLSFVVDDLDGANVVQYAGTIYELIK